MTAKRLIVLAALALCGQLVRGCAAGPAKPDAALAEVPIAADAISGVVGGGQGPEAGVWVIAETTDLPTRLIKIVVTDDRGRYLLPELPHASYKLWTRGYGLVDSPKVDARPGMRVSLTSVTAPTRKAAAQYYPANYWHAMMRMPSAAEFPGSPGGSGGIGPAMKTRQHWLSNAKSCMICHQVGNPTMREPADISAETWELRAGMARPPGDPAMGLLGGGYANVMTLTMRQFGPRGLQMYSAWSDNIAKGELPAQSPPRPVGIERNAVLTIWDWGDKTFIHDLIATDPLAVQVGGNGPIYGAESNAGRFVIADPAANTARSIDIPDGLTHPMLVTMDRKGRIWFPTYGRAFLKEDVNQDLAPKPHCPDEWREGSRKGFVSSPRIEHMRMFDPATDKLITLPTCLATSKAQVASDPQDTLFFTSDSVVTWINTRVWDDSHDPVRSQGWCPVILNTAGHNPDPLLGLTNGTLDQGQWNILGKPGIASKNTRIAGQFVFRARRNPVDDSIWITAYRGLPGGIIRIERGKNPPYSCTSEYFEPPRDNALDYRAYGPMNLDFDSKGAVWVAFLSGNLGRFDPRLCKVRRGPGATGQHCAEGWSFHDIPGPRFVGTNDPADFNYGLLVDKFNVFGTGRDAALLAGGNSDSLVVSSPGQGVIAVIRVPYPMGFYARELSGRIDDPAKGWKGRAVWGSFNTIPVWHQEGGEDHSPGLVRFQLRPTPLDH